jgi:hypothetical protein
VIDYKYEINPNIFCCNPRNSSPFWKGVIWAAKTAKLGFRWRVGNGKRVRFWEDLWFGTCSLAIQYWNIYSIISDQGKTVSEAWDGVRLKFTFSRTVDFATWNNGMRYCKLLVVFNFLTRMMPLHGSTNHQENIMCRPYISLSTIEVLNKLLLLSCGKFQCLLNCMCFFSR